MKHWKRMGENILQSTELECLDLTTSDNVGLTNECIKELFGGNGIKIANWRSFICHATI